MKRAALMVLLALSPWTSVLPDSITLPSIPAKSVYFVNSATKKIIFYVSADGKTWTEFSLESGASQIVSLDGPIDNLTTAIQTGNIVCKVSVEVKNRYEIIWDSAQSGYCMRRLAPR
jgi:hypothetical protein